MWRILDVLLSFASGEFLFNRRPNGGAVVFVRAVWSSLIAYVFAVALKERLAPGATWNFCGARLSAAVAETLPWFGAIFAGSYAALYTRFASQWSYLAGLYNQIMAAQVAASNRDEHAEHALLAWKAGFIEDAEEVHLHRKPVYAWVILSMLADESVRQLYQESTPGGEVRLNRVEAEVRKVFEEEDRKQKRKT